MAAAGLFEPAPGAPGRSVGKEIEYVAQHAAVGPEELRITAAHAGYGRKPFSLHIENFAPETACGPNLPHVALSIRALGTTVVEFSHDR